MNIQFSTHFVNTVVSKLDCLSKEEGVRFNVIVITNLKNNTTELHLIQNNYEILF